MACVDGAWERDCLNSCGEKFQSQCLQWFVYLLLCGDNSLYCGIAKNVEERFAAHVHGKGARYTRGRGPLQVAWKLDAPVTHSDALKLERFIKRLSRDKKMRLINGLDAVDLGAVAKTGISWK